METEFRDLRSKIISEFRGKDNQRVSFSVKGKSMVPLISDQDQVTLLDTQPNKIHQGDIIAFLSRGELIVHRVIRHKFIGKEIIFCQKGDSSPHFSWIRGKEVLGKVVEIKNDNKKIKLTNFPWHLHDRFLALLGSLWVFIIARGVKVKRANEYFLSQSGALALSKPKRGLFLIIKTMSFAFTSICAKWGMGSVFET